MTESPSVDANAGTVRVNMWSGPRNVSTAFMYSWRQRQDTTVVDEPLYAHYLRVTGIDHPGRAATLASQDDDGERVVRNVILGDYDTPVVMLKQMAKHLVDLDRSFLARCRNVLLVREPRAMLTSFQRHLPNADLAETGYSEIVEILDATIAAGGEPIVIDSRLLLEDPEGVLTEMCARLELPFDPAMLSWPAGPKDEDGSWAVHWYDAAHRSTGWAPYREKTDSLLPQLEPVVAEAEALYERLLPYAITGRTS